MTRLFVLSAAILAFAASGGSATAQTKKSTAKCPANYFEACMKRCTGAGGQPRFCPQYCEKRKAEQGC